MVKRLPIGVMNSVSDCKDKTKNRHHGGFFMGAEIRFPAWGGVARSDGEGWFSPRMGEYDRRSGGGYHASRSLSRIHQNTPATTSWSPSPWGRNYFLPSAFVATAARQVRAVFYDEYKHCIFFFYLASRHAWRVFLAYLYFL